MSHPLERIEQCIREHQAEAAIKRAELERLVRQAYMNLSDIIHMEYEKMSAGCRISFTLVDEEHSIEHGAEQMKDGKSPYPACMTFPRTAHNLGVLKKMVEALEAKAIEAEATDE